MSWITTVVFYNVLLALLLGAATAALVVCELRSRQWYLSLGLLVLIAWMMLLMGTCPATGYFVLTAGQSLLVIKLARHSYAHKRTGGRRIFGSTFSLRNMLIAISLVGAGISLASTLPFHAEVNQSLWWSSVLSTAIVLSVTWARFQSKRIWLQMLVVSCVVIGAIILRDDILSTSNSLLIDVRRLRNDSAPTVPYHISQSDLSAMVFGITFAAYLNLAMYAASPGDARSNWIAKLARYTAFCVTMVAVVMGSFLYYRIVRTAPIFVASTPQNNGHELFRIAGEKLQTVVIPEAGRDSASEFTQFAKEHRETIELVRRGVEKPCQFPLDWHRSNDMNRMIPLALTTANALVANSIALHQDEDERGAAASAVLCIRFSDQWSRGGLVIHWRNAFAMEDMGIRQLKVCRTRLDALECARLAKQLMEIDSSHEPLSDLIRRDRRWYDMAGQWRHRAANAISDLIPGSRENMQLQRISQLKDVKLRLMTAELAVQAYCLDKNQPPASLGDLIPSYLPRIPIDPYSDQPLRYRVHGGTPIVYSVGPDGIDDGGNIRTWRQLVAAESGDVTLAELIGK